MVYNIIQKVYINQTNLLYLSNILHDNPKLLLSPKQVYKITGNYIKITIHVDKIGCQKNLKSILATIKAI
jgi:hypothetical protein